MSGWPRPVPKIISEEIIFGYRTIICIKILWDATYFQWYQISLLPEWCRLQEKDNRDNTVMTMVLRRLQMEEKKRLSVNFQLSNRKWKIKWMGKMSQIFQHSEFPPILPDLNWTWTPTYTDLNTTGRTVNTFELIMRWFDSIQQTYPPTHGISQVNLIFFASSPNFSNLNNLIL